MSESLPLRGLSPHSSIGGSSRFETFTEAVPLSLSSMAHACVPLTEGVLDGLRQVLQHTLLQCVNYARIVHPPHQWSFRDLATSKFAWTPAKGELNVGDLPFALQKMEFKHQYSRNAWIYLVPAIPKDLTLAKELELLDDWKHEMGILAQVKLLYASSEPLTPGEMDGTDIEDIPPCILYKACVEYRSLPATGNQHAVLAEELSMLSVGGSVDDDVKFGALASLYDEQAKYVLEIYSVRGKKYKFDLMDSTLSDGTVPRLPSSSDGDPFVKSLCVTVTDYNVTEHSHGDGDDQYAITRMHLTMEGKPRQVALNGKDHWADDLPAFSYMFSGICKTFLRLNPIPPTMVTATPSGHSLLLDPDQAGNIYVNGRFVTRWGDDPRIGTHGVVLFGMDLHSVPVWRGKIADFEVLKYCYAQLWQEVLINADLKEWNISRRLLHRLIRGEDPDEDDDELYDDEFDSDRGQSSDGEVVNPNVDALESIVMSSPTYDPVGIAAKALATRFAMEFGPDAFPSLAHETEWIRRTLPDREPIVVPQRLINILRRGGYFDCQKTADLLWFGKSRLMNPGMETEIVNCAVQFLEESGCYDVDTENIVFVSTPVARNVVTDHAVCRWNAETEQFFVQQDFMSLPVDEFNGEKMIETDPTRIKGYLLGMYIAQAHPFGKVLARYLVRNRLS